MSLYDEFYPVALELLTEDGADAQLIRAGVQTYDPITSEVVEETIMVPALAVLDELEWNEEDGRQTIRSTAILLAKPEIGDTLLLGDLSFSVVRRRGMAPQGKAIIWLAEVR